MGTIRKTSLRFGATVYYAILFILGSLGISSMSSCGNAAEKEAELKRRNDSIAEVKRNDSIHQADSLAAAALEQVRLDSIAKAKADSAAKAQQQNHNNYKPKPPMTKYGVPRPN